MDWYLKSAAQGNAKSMYRLGRIYLQGREGIPRNSSEATNWLNKAVENGNRAARALVSGGQANSGAPAVKVTTPGDGAVSNVAGSPDLSGLDRGIWWTADSGSSCSSSTNPAEKYLSLHGGGAEPIVGRDGEIVTVSASGEEAVFYPTRAKCERQFPPKEVAPVASAQPPAAPIGEVIDPRNGEQFKPIGKGFYASVKNGGYVKSGAQLIDLSTGKPPPY